MWNTFTFFNILKESERTKMDIWGVAQNNIAVEDEPSDLILNILQSNTTTPMLLYSHIQDSYTEKTFQRRILIVQKKFKNLLHNFLKNLNPLKLFMKKQFCKPSILETPPLSIK